MTSRRELYHSTSSGSFESVSLDQQQQQQSLLHQQQQSLMMQGATIADLSGILSSTASTTSNSNNNNTRLQEDQNNGTGGSVLDPLLSNSIKTLEDDGENNDDDDYDTDDYDSVDNQDDDEDDDVSFDENDPTTLHLRIKSCRDTDITVRSTDSVATVKQAVLKSLEADPHRYLRLILKGRLLAPDSRPLGEFNVSTGDVVHAVLAAEGQRGGAQALLASAGACTLLSAAEGGGIVGGLGALQGLHQRLNNNGAAGANANMNSRVARALLRGAGVTPSGLAMRWNNNPFDDQDESETSSLEEGRERLGFDRLRSPPPTSTTDTSPRLSRAEVTAIRAYFSRQVDRWIRHNPDAVAQATVGESDLMRRRYLLEEAWMDAQGPTSEFRLNLAGTLTNNHATLAAAARGNSAFGGPGPSWRVATGPGGQPIMMMTSVGSAVGTDRDFLWGFLLGFVVGFLMLLWVWMPNVPHKQKLGILTGISFQLALSMLQGRDEQESDDAFIGN